jgi:hypothetical protein
MARLPPCIAVELHQRTEAIGLTTDDRDHERQTKRTGPDH